MPPITIIELWGTTIECVICDAQTVESRSGPSYGVARYEDEVVPDSYQGEWGGASTCETCYWIERGLHASEPLAFIPFDRIRRLRLAAQDLPNETGK